MPRRRASWAIALKPTWRPETPPHACWRSPPPRCFSSAVAGEWSLTMVSMIPARSACQSSSRLPASRMGGQHLNCGAASGMVSAAKHR